MYQISGADLQGMDLEELHEISPNRTRVERKLLLQMIEDIQAVAQVSLVLCWPYCVLDMGVRQRHTHIFAHVQNPSNTSGLLRQLKEWFPGDFRAIVGTLYVKDDTTVVQATHKVSPILDLVAKNARPRLKMHSIAHRSPGMLPSKSFSLMTVNDTRKPSGRSNFYRCFTNNHGSANISTARQ